jgi:hypothetical protein
MDLGAIVDDENRAILSWLGGGVVVAISGGWAWYKYIKKTRTRNHETIISVTANRGSVAVGHSISDSKVTTTHNK